MKDLFRSLGSKGKATSNDQPAETELNEQDLEQVTGAGGGGDHHYSDDDDCEYDHDDYCHRHHHHRHHPRHHG